jgi:hypothetical protein
VKGLSHEIFIVPEADIVFLTEGRTLIADIPNGTWQGDASPATSEKVDYIIPAFGIVLLNVNQIADHIDEIKGRDGTISFNKSWTHEVHLVHFVDLCGI